MLNDKPQTTTQAEDKPVRVGTHPRMAIYAQAAKHAPKAIKRLAIEMEEGDNSNARVAAARTLLAKCIPDLHESEVKSDGRTIELFINLGSGFVPATLRLPTPSARSITAGQSPLQSTGVASES